MEWVWDLSGCWIGLIIGEIGGDLVWVCITLIFLIIEGVDTVMVGWGWNLGDIILFILKFFFWINVVFLYLKFEEVRFFLLFEFDFLFLDDLELFGFWGNFGFVLGIDFGGFLLFVIFWLLRDCLWVLI